jgi:hypothetical protein
MSSLLDDALDDALRRLISEHGSERVLQRLKAILSRGRGRPEGSKNKKTSPLYEKLQREVINLTLEHRFLDGSACNPPLRAKATCVHTAIERVLDKYKYLPKSNTNKARVAAKQHLIRHFKDYKWWRWVHRAPKAAGGASAVAVGACDITAHGRTQSLTEWARERRVSAETIRERLKCGWTAEDAVTKR